MILGFIRELAEYEKLAHEVVATRRRCARTLFGARPAAEVLIARGRRRRRVGFALFFHELLDVPRQAGALPRGSVRPARTRAARASARALMSALAKIAVERDYGRFEWAVLDWNDAAIRFYRSLGAVGRPSGRCSG